MVNTIGPAAAAPRPVAAAAPAASPAVNPPKIMAVATVRLFKVNPTTNAYEAAG